MQEDSKIVDMYWNREQVALRETQEKYGNYLYKIAYNILNDKEDSQESVNDTYLKAWNSMPPHRPKVLSTYLGKITREHSIDILRRKNRKKRHDSEYMLSLSELEECVSGGQTPQEIVELKLLAEAIRAFLKRLPTEKRVIFVGRYYFMDSIKEIATYYNQTESNVKTTLHRLRLELKEHLQQEGFHV